MVSSRRKPSEIVSALIGPGSYEYQLTWLAAKLALWQLFCIQLKITENAKAFFTVCKAIIILNNTPQSNEVLRLYNIHFLKNQRHGWSIYADAADVTYQLLWSFNRIQAYLVLRQIDLCQATHRFQTTRKCYVLSFYHADHPAVTDLLFTDSNSCCK